MELSRPSTRDKSAVKLRMLGKLTTLVSFNFFAALHQVAGPEVARRSTNCFAVSSSTGIATSKVDTSHAFRQLKLCNTFTSTARRFSGRNSMYFYAVGMRRCNPSMDPALAVCCGFDGLKPVLPSKSASSNCGALIILISVIPQEGGG